MAEGDDRLGKATRDWVTNRRNASSALAGDILIMFELAIDAADMADRARTSGDDRVYLAAAMRLQQLIRAANYDDIGGAGFGSGDPWSADLARAMGTGAGMGNTA